MLDMPIVPGLPRGLARTSADRVVPGLTRQRVRSWAPAVSSASASDGPGALARRFGWTAHTDPDKIERDVTALLPQREWTAVSHRVIWHGRRVCHARRPACGACGVKWPAGARRSVRARPARRQPANSSRPVPFRDRTQMLVCPLALPGGINRSVDVGTAVTGQPWNICCGRAT